MTIHDQRVAIHKVMEQLSRSTTRKYESTGGRPKEQDSYSEVARRIGCSEAWIRQSMTIHDQRVAIHKVVESLRSTSQWKPYKSTDQGLREVARRIGCSEAWSKASISIRTIAKYYAKV